jgi:putative Mg2+ transporter-C (MgtC) family protein
MEVTGLLALQLAEPTGEGWTQVIEILFALLLSSAIGLERELGQKNAGLRTHALVGVGAALFMLVSKYGFTDVLEKGVVVLDPSRIAAQIVTGIGFIGGGLIFVRSDYVRGLTTAAVVWVTAAIGAACGAGLPLLAAIATGCHFLVVQGYPRIVRRFGAHNFFVTTFDVRYLDGRGLLRTILAAATQRGFMVSEITTSSIESEHAANEDAGANATSDRVVDVRLQLQGPLSVHDLTAVLSEIDGVISVTAGTSFEASE